MKKSIITIGLFLIAISFSAQEKGHKNTTPIKDTKVVVNPIKPNVFNQKNNMVVVPVANVKYQTSTTRATSSTNRPEQVKGERKDNVKVVNNRSKNAPKPTGLNPEKVKEVTKERNDK
jgi:hypothetical protein